MQKLVIYCEILLMLIILLSDTDTDYTVES